MEAYRQVIDGRSKTRNEAGQFTNVEEIERSLRLAAIKAEREEVHRLGRTQKSPEEMVSKLVREIDLLEARFS